ncbi:MAG: hypothetical protein MUF27_09835 [Acidobacteria bacterium]|nr:hypothetical protein [Acidobacteriota bacterium]
MNTFVLRVYDPRGPMDGLLLELREDHALSDLHWAIASALGVPGEGGYAFDLAGDEAPDFDDPDFVLDEKVAALFPLREVIDELGGRIWHRAGEGIGTEIVPDRLRVAYARASYPRRAGDDPDGPPVFADATEATRRLRSEALVHAAAMDEIVRRGTVGELDPEHGPLDPRAALARLGELLDWAAVDRRRIAAVEMLTDSHWSYWLRQWLTGEAPRLGLSDEAAALLARWAELDRREEALARRALVLAKAGRGDEAAAEADAVLASPRRDGWAMFLAAQALEAAGRADRAEAVYRELLDAEEIPPAFEIGVLERLAPLLARAGRAAEAAPLAERRAALEQADARRRAGGGPGEEDADEDLDGLLALDDDDEAIDDEDDDELMGLVAAEAESDLEIGAPELPGEGEEGAAFRSARAALLEFAAQPLHAPRIAAALAEAMDEELSQFTLQDLLERFEPRSAAQALVEWVLFDHRDDRGRTLAALFLDEPGAALDEEQRRALQRAAASPVSLYRVKAIAPGRAMTLADLPRGRTVEVVDSLLAHRFDPEELVAMRVVELDGVLRPTGGYFAFAAEDMGELMAALLQAYEDYTEIFPGSGWDEVLREHFDLFPAFLAFKSVREPQE